MSKILLFTLMFGLSLYSFAQCTPDLTIKRSGTFPDKLQDADLNVAYSQVVQFKSPSDTTVFVPQLNTTLPVEIDSMRVMEVIGLPPGMSYACHNNTCMINGGGVGCIIISGTCATPGGYPIKIIVKTSAKAILGVTKIPQTQIDTNEHYGVFVNWPTGLAQVIANNSINVFPNPAKNVLMIEGDFSGNQSAVSIYDALGKKVFTQELSAHNYTNKVDIKNLENGLYWVEIKSGQTNFTKRLLVAND
jgi:hypothetical protein